jgi:hypothetical protein
MRRMSAIPLLDESVARLRNDGAAEAVCTQ